MGDRKITFSVGDHPLLISQPIRLRTCEEVFVRSGAPDLIAVSCRSQASERELGAAGECGLFFAPRYRINQRQRSAVSLPELDDAGQSRLQCTPEGWLIIAGDASAMQRIVVATDGSAGGNRAVDAAVKLARAAHCKLLILTVGGSISGAELRQLAGPRAI